MEVNAWLKEAFKAKVGLFLSALRPAHAVPLVNRPHARSVQRRTLPRRARRGRRGDSRCGGFQALQLRRALYRPRRLRRGLGGSAETAEDLDAAIAGCERVRDHVASLRRQLRLREELEILRRDNDRLKRIREAKIEELREELEQLRRDNDRLKRTKKRKTSNVTGAVSGGDVEMSEAPSPGT